MAPLPKSERRRFLEEGMRLGVPRDRLFGDLARLEGQTQRLGDPLAAPLADNPNAAPTWGEQTAYDTDKMIQRENVKNIAQTGVLMAAGGIGGSVARTVLGAARGAATPMIAATAARIPMPVAAAAGEAAGAYAGSRGLGASPRESRINALAAGGAGLVVEGGLNLMARGGLAGAGVSHKAINEALTRPPGNYPGAASLRGRVGASPRTARGLMYGRPGEMAERTVGVDTLSRISESLRDVSPGRLAKVDVMQAAEKAGVRIKLDDTLNATVAAMDAKPISPGAKLANRRFTALWDDITKHYGNDVTPAEADEILGKVRNSVVNLYDKANTTELIGGSKKVAETLKESFYRQIEDALPGSDIAGKAKASRAYLDSVETLDTFVSDKTPEAFVKELFKGDDVSQSALTALREFEKQTGTSGTLERTIRDLSMKREFTSTDRVSLGRIFYILERVLSRPIGKAAALAARPAGSLAAGATAAFSDAMQKRKPAPQENP